MKSLPLLFVVLAWPSLVRAVDEPPVNAPAAIAPSFQIEDDAFSKILGLKPSILLLANGFGFTEGPVYFSLKPGSEEGYLFFSDIKLNNVNMIKWNGVGPFNKISNLSWEAPTAFRSPSAFACGQTADLSGHLLTGEGGGRRVSMTAKDGSLKTVVGAYKGTPLNSPNDLVVKSDGTIWFTDPLLGSLLYPQEANLPCNVYRFDPKSNELTVVVSDLVIPNGIAFSPDEKLLYVIDSGTLMNGPGTLNAKGPHDIHVYDVAANGKSVGSGRVFAVVTPGFPDGMRLDADGNLYVGAFDGVQVFNPDGKLIGKILLMKQTANLCFGGKDNNILFICSSNSVWAIRLNTKGAKPVPVLNSGGDQ